MEKVEFISPKISIELNQIYEISEINKQSKFVVKKTGKPLKKTQIQRLTGLGIPRVYETIWLSKSDSSDIQAIALDKKNRKQYYYSKKWCQERETKKSEKVKNLFGVVKEIRKKTDNDKKRKGNVKIKTMAYMLRILELCSIRIGNTKYLDKYNSYGLTTLKKEHITFEKTSCVLNFNGKHNVKQKIVLKDKPVIRFLKNMFDLPEDWLMKYTNDTKVYYRVSAQDLNNYLHSIVLKLNHDTDFSCKDYRTYGANFVFLEKLQERGVPVSSKELAKNISDAIEDVSNTLGNNKAVSKSSYVMNEIIQCYKDNPAALLKHGMEIL